ncbi:hypothetical protein GCM10023321_44460 [Pseudonocardia eucalypti]|uniref:Mce-associated membrane protein n=1 Tax=Pseudonocardia eucalypti TaxID=648755 RepID=A0ABP9QF78_9PSEU|nr:hypothetical protein [Pseudonocardia eucalypti]
MNARTLTILGVAAAALLAAPWLPLAGPDPASPAPALSQADRDALAAPPVDAGPAPAAPDPQVDFADPASVARAYLVAAYSVGPADNGRTNRRATPYATSAVGVVVVDAPPTGQRAITVTDVTQIAGEPSDTRRGYTLGYRTTPGDSPRRTRYLLLVRQPDNRWLVAGDRADAQVGEQ